MKRDIYYILISVALLLTGCISEDRSGCDDDGCCTGDCDNFVLLFSYLDYDTKKDGRDVFLERIDNIDIFIYDSDFNFYQHVETSAQELEPTRSKSMRLEPGEYYIMSWANNTSSRNGIPEIYENTRLGEKLLYHNHGTSADPLHYAPDQRNLFSQDREQEEYAPLKIIIPQSGTVAYTLNYMSAHRTLNVYLKGFSDISEEKTGNPEVSVFNLTLYYNNLLDRGKEVTQYTQTAIKTQKEGNEYGFTSFYLPHFDMDEDVEVTIKGHSGNEPYEFQIPMQQILEELEIEELFDGDNRILEIIVENKGTFVEITLPGWGVIIVNPF